MQVEDGLHVTENRKRQKKKERKLNLREWRNWSVQIEELTERIIPTVLVF